MHDLVQIFGTLILLGCGVVLPITIVWLGLRKKMNEDNIRKEIILAALEKNAEVDIEELIKKTNGPKKLLKEKLLQKLQTSIITISLGLGIIGYALFVDFQGRLNPFFIRLCYLSGLALFAVSMAFGISYLVGKKMFAREMEAESEALEEEKA